MSAEEVGQEVAGQIHKVGTTGIAGLHEALNADTASGFETAGKYVGAVVGSLTGLGGSSIVAAYTGGIGLPFVTACGAGGGAIGARVGQRTAKRLAQWWQS